LENNHPQFSSGWLEITAGSFSKTAIVNGDWRERRMGTSTGPDIFPEMGNCISLLMILQKLQPATRVIRLAPV